MINIKLSKLEFICNEEEFSVFYDSKRGLYLHLINMNYENYVVFANEILNIDTIMNHDYELAKII